MAARRGYSQTTIKLLFAASGNQCAHPDCTNTVVIEGTNQSEAMISAQIAHIYAASDNGPRGKPGLTQTEKNAPENLILLCPTHHGIVDGQYETFPASLLQAWKAQHEAKFRRPISVESASLAIRLSTAKSLVDAAIDKELMLLRQARFLGEFDHKACARRLMDKLIAGEYSGGGDEARGRALAWCARLLSASDDKTEASKALGAAQQLWECDEVRIARAFCQAANGDDRSALSALSTLNSPAAYTAAFQIIVNKQDAEQGIEWLAKAGLSSSELDPDGKLVLLQKSIELARWDGALKVADSLLPNDFLQAPILHHLCGLAYLLRTVPLEIRSGIVTQLPFAPRTFPLASGTEATGHRRLAIEHFRKFAIASCPQATKSASDYALWLELRDPATSLSARANLEASLRDKIDGLRRLPMALDFGIKVDVQAVETEIDKQTALAGGHTVDTALARLALALAKPNARDAAKYIETYRDELLRFLDRIAVFSLEIEMLARSGSIDKARKTLDELRSSGLEGSTYRSLDRIISECQGEDPVAARRSQFESTKSLQDLALLVDALEENEDWASLSDLAENLFQKTGAVQDAERFAITLNNLGQDERLQAFLEANANLISHSPRLAQVRCWVLFRGGHLNDAATSISALRANRDSTELRFLRLNVAIAAGDWDTLNALVAENWRLRDERNAEELFRSAQLGLIISSPHARDLLFEAASRAENDADLLVGSYSLATNAGIEDDERVAVWFSRAIELSGSDGPIQKASLKELIERKPEWDRREADTWKMLAEGSLPIFGAARLLNRTLIDLFLYPALANLSEADPRKRGLVPAFSGARQSPPSPLATNYGFDPTAMMTFSILGVLDKVLDSIPVVRIPHSTMGWLLEEKQRAAFHQPSRIRAAHGLRHLVASGKLRVFDGGPSTDADLLAEVDDDLAALISECATGEGNSKPQRLVIRSYPVHKIGSLMEETADLEKYQNYLCSCTGVLKKLKARAQLTEQEATDALNYLSANEKNWPNQPDIGDDAELFLDDLSINYLQHTGVLRKLKDAGLTAYVSRRAVDEADALIAYEELANEVVSHLDNLRQTLAKGVRSGKVIVGGVSKNAAQDRDPIGSHPSFAVVEMASGCEAIVVDDRFLNQHAFVESDRRHIPILTSAELLDSLQAAGSLPMARVVELRTRLRQATYVHAPIELQELLDHLGSSEVPNGSLLENAELRAIRENVLRVRMSNYLRLPQDAPWLNRLTVTLTSAIRLQWNAEIDNDIARARSNWLLNLLDIRGWSFGHGQAPGNRMFDHGYATFVSLLMMPPQSATEETKDRYWSWLEAALLEPLRVEQPALYAWLLDATKSEIARLVIDHSSPGEPT